MHGCLGSWIALPGGGRLLQLAMRVFSLFAAVPAVFPGARASSAPVVVVSGPRAVKGSLHSFLLWLFDKVFRFCTLLGSAWRQIRLGEVSNR